MQFASAESSFELLAYKILRRLPRDWAGYSYQIKTNIQPFDQVAKESEIELLSHASQVQGGPLNGGVLNFKSIGNLASETAM